MAETSKSAANYLPVVLHISFWQYPVSNSSSMLTERSTMVAFGNKYHPIHINY